MKVAFNMLVTKMAKAKAHNIILTTTKEQPDNMCHNPAALEFRAFFSYLAQSHTVTVAFRTSFTRLQFTIGHISTYT